MGEAVDNLPLYGQHDLVGPGVGRSFGGCPASSLEVGVPLGLTVELVGDVDEDEGEGEAVFP
eukprot:2654788-Heterocapsa_arctica.AAC.1